MPANSTPMPAPAHALLLAAGAGSRLRPLTDLVPKPLLPIDGAPVISTLVEQLHRTGVRTFVVVVGPDGALLRAHLERSMPPDAAVTIVEQPEPAGSADAVRHGLTAIDRSTPVVLAGCDTVWREHDIATLLEAHVRTAPLVTMGARRWPVDRLPHHSCMDVDAELRVRRVLASAPAGATTALSGSPIYVVHARFWDYVEAIVPSTNGVLELASGIQAAIDDGEHVQAFEVSDTRDLTRPIDLLRHNFPYLEDVLD